MRGFLLTFPPPGIEVDAAAAKLTIRQLDHAGGLAAGTQAVERRWAHTNLGQDLSKFQRRGTSHKHFLHSKTPSNRRNRAGWRTEPEPSTTHARHTSYFRQGATSATRCAQPGPPRLLFHRQMEPLQTPQWSPRSPVRLTGDRRLCCAPPPWDTSLSATDRYTRNYPMLHGHATRNCPTAGVITRPGRRSRVSRTNSSHIDRRAAGEPCSSGGVVRSHSPGKSSSLLWFFLVCRGRMGRPLASAVRSAARKPGAGALAVIPSPTNTA